MTPADAIAEIERGEARNVYVVVGEERIFADRVVAAARAHVVNAATSAFNLETFEAGEGAIDRPLDAARTMPMMAKKRLIILRSLERLEAKADSSEAADEAPAKAKTISSPLDKLAEYVQAPVPSACLMMVASKLNKSRRLYKYAEKAGALVLCEPLRPQQLAGFVRDEAKRRGNAIGGDIAQLVVDLIGGDLCALCDAIERLSLFAGPEKAIDEHAVEQSVAKVSVGSVWGLADAVADKQRGKALRLLNENFEQGEGLRLLALLGGSMRKTLKVRALLAAGTSPDEIARQAGIPPFRVTQVVAQAKRFAPGELERAIASFVEVDLALKGSRRPPLLVLEELIMRLT
ncbi:MAG: DNA polymerase III subunit delta [Polyangiales bacterium]